VRDKGRHDLIMRGLGAHAHSNISVFKTTTVFFSGKYGFNVFHIKGQSKNSVEQTTQQSKTMEPTVQAAL